MSRLTRCITSRQHRSTHSSAACGPYCSRRRSGTSGRAVRGDPRHPAAGTRSLPPGRVDCARSCCGVPARWWLASQRPAQLHDAKAAIRWLRARADETGIDASRIAAWGESSGGHLAALLGLTGPDLDGEIGITGPSSAVVTVAAWYAPSALATIARDTGADPMAGDSANPAGRRTAARRARPRHPSEPPELRPNRRAAVSAAAWARRPLHPVLAE
jgi:poly(3-hydroxybutyrate) depolymerase